MRQLIPAASAVFTTALAGPNRRRVLVPLRPSMDDAPPPIPYALTSTTVTWRKPIAPWRLRALVHSSRRGQRTKQTVARHFLARVLAKGPQPASLIQQDAKALHITKYQLDQARAFYQIITVRAQPSDSDTERWCWTFPPESERQKADALESLA